MDPVTITALIIAIAGVPALIAAFILWRREASDMQSIPVVVEVNQDNWRIDYDKDHYDRYHHGNFET